MDTYNKNTSHYAAAYWIMVCFLVVLMAAVIPGYGQVITPFAPRTSPSIYKIRGDFNMIGNSNLTLATYNDNTNNSNNIMVYTDIDNDASTWNSSSATLAFSTENGAIPACSNILFAGLYWTGRSDLTGDVFTVTNGTGTKTFDKKVIKIKGPGDAAYTTLPAAPSTSIYYPTSTEAGMYAGFADVTNFVKTRGVGEYTVADLALLEGNGGGTGYYGGWSMVVVYENSKMNWRDVTLFDGYAYVVGGAVAEHELPISGFQAVQNGQVNIKVGVMAGEGDVGIPGDFLEIRNKDDNAWVRLNHSGNTTGNFFNGSIQTGGNTRNPVFQNNTGLDIAMFNLPNTNNSLITNNQTSTRFKYGSTQDTYIIFNLAFSVDAYVPAVNSVLGSVVAPDFKPLPGQAVPYTVEIKNKGTEAVNNYVIDIPVPPTATVDISSLAVVWNPKNNPFVGTAPSTNTLTYVPGIQTGNQGTGGFIRYNASQLPLITADKEAILVDIKFSFVATTNCVILRNPDCKNVIPVQGVSSGVGAISQTSFSNQKLITGFIGAGETCVGDPITAAFVKNIDAKAYFDQGFCPVTDFNTNDIRVFKEDCNTFTPGGIIPVSFISGSFPEGTRFYDKVPPNNTTEYTSTNGFPPINLGRFVAVPLNGTGCELPFDIDACEIPQTVSGQLWIDKNGNFVKDTDEDISQQPLHGAPYQIVAVASNDIENPDKMVKRTLVAGADGTYTFTIPGNPVRNILSNLSQVVDPVFSLVLYSGTGDPSNGGNDPTPPSSIAGMGNAPGSPGVPESNKPYYSTGPLASGNFNKEGILSNLQVSGPWLPITNKNIGMQSRPTSQDVEAILSGTIKGKTFIPLVGYPLFAFDNEQGPLQAGKEFRILTLPQPKTISGKTIVIQLAYDKDDNGPTEADLITSIPTGGYKITAFDPDLLYAYYVSGDINGLNGYGEFFQYTGVDAAGVGSMSNNPMPAANQAGGSDAPLGSGTDGAAVYTLSGAIILPVAGIELAGSYNSGKASLRWKLNGTDDAARYELERGNNATGFRTVTTISANGREYNHVDDLGAFTGADAFYRVKMIRTNGTVSYSNVISLKLATITGLQLMPTVVQSNLQVRFNNTRSQEVVIRVMNVTGQVVMTQTSKLSAGNASISLSGFERVSNGTYSVQVFTGTSVTQGKIVVQH